jgi:hypothetical protein
MYTNPPMAWKVVEPTQCAAAWSIKCGGPMLEAHGTAICESCLFAARVTLHLLTPIIHKVTCSTCGSDAPCFGGEPAGPLCKACLDGGLALAAAQRTFPLKFSFG